MSRRTNTIRRNKAAKRQRQRQRDFLAALRHVEQHSTVPYNVFERTLVNRLIHDGYIFCEDGEWSLTSLGELELGYPEIPADRLITAIDRHNCTACEGTGLDRTHHWPDGSHAHCETCDGYGIR